MNRDMENTVLTIGHSNHSWESFAALLERHGVGAVADVRSAPYSRFNPHFDRETFASALKERGMAYVYLGRELGGRSEDPGSYEGGRIRYDRIALTERFRDGIERVVRGAGKHRIALMCAEKEPLDCHRTLLVAPALEREGIDVMHVHADGVLEPNAQAMDRLLDKFDLRPDGDLFQRSREELVAEAIALQARRVAHVDDTPAGGRERSR